MFYAKFFGRRSRMKNLLTRITVQINLVLFLLIIVFSFFGSVNLFSVAGKHFSLSFFISLLAIPFFYCSYFLLYRNHFLNPTIKLFLVLFSVLFISSLGMGYVLYPKYNGLFETSPIKVVVLNAAKYLYDLSLIPYFMFCLSIVRKNTIKRALLFFLGFWILFGFLQIFVFYLNNPTIWQIYDAIDFLQILGGRSAVFERIRLNYGSFRFFGIASEPATNAVIIDIIFLPFLFSELSRKRKRPIYTFFLLSSLVVVLFFAALTKSASVYAGLFLLGAILFWRLLSMEKVSKKAKIAVIFSLFFALVALLIVPITRELLVDKFLLKILDTSDHSTQHRYSSVWNDLLVLVRFPLFGVGDGNQGYFYLRNIIGTWMANNSETQMALRGELGLMGGGAGIPSIISGFGIFGTLLIIGIFTKLYQEWALKNIHFPKIRIHYKTSLTIFLFLLIATQGIHRNYPLYFCLSSISIGAFRVSCSFDVAKVLLENNLPGFNGSIVGRGLSYEVSI